MEKSIVELPVDLQEKVRSWLQYDELETTRNEIVQLCLKQDVAELHKRLDDRISFGTSGLRGRMEAGFSRMNALTVKQASQGLAKYVKSQFPDNLTVVVGHDHRHNSELFAQTTVDTFLQLGFKVYRLKQGSNDSLVHTPMVPFTIDTVGASAGVMVTASHNPKMDNGYKVYYANGCQIIPPHDKLIAETILESLEPLQLPLAGSVVDCKEDMTEKYVNAVSSALFEGNKIPDREGPWFVYTPMHGVGFEIFERVSRQVLSLEEGKHYLVVEEQRVPDPEFPTVSFPNPEEKGALDLAMEYGNKSDSIDLIVANDPDADRFSVAVKDATTGTWKQLTGNDIGFLIAFHEWEKYKQSGVPKPFAVLNSTVSSQMLKRMAELEGFHHEDTLTGFKWLGNRARELESQGYYTPFAYEESIGYMFSSVVHDKDGVGAAVVFLQAYSQWRARGQSALDILALGSQRYGCFKEFNGYYVVPDLTVTKKVFDAIRSTEKPFPTKLGSSFEIVKFRDLTTGYQSDTADHVPLLACDPSSQMITCEVVIKEQPASRVRFTIRGSGTEPKLKVYIEARTQSEPTSLALAKFTWDVLRDEWFNPELTGIITPF